MPRRNIDGNKGFLSQHPVLLLLVVVAFSFVLLVLNLIIPRKPAGSESAETVQELRFRLENERNAIRSKYEEELSQIERENQRLRLEIDRLKKESNR